MLRIARLDAMEVEAEVNENDVVNITLGDSARIEVDAYPGRTFWGVVTEIANSARVAAQGTQEQITNFPVKVRIVDPHNEGLLTAVDGLVAADEVSLPAKDIPQFRPGMSSTVDIETDFVDECVSIPIQAVTVRDFASLPSADSVATAEVDSASMNLDYEEDLRTVVFVLRDGEATWLRSRRGFQMRPGSRSQVDWMQVTKS